MDLVVFSVGDVWPHDMVPWPLAFAIAALFFAPVLIVPFFMKGHAEPTGKRGFYLTSAIVCLIGGAVYAVSFFSLHRQQEALVVGDYKTITGTFEGWEVTDYGIATRAKGIRVSGQLIEAPGGLIGAWSEKSLPRFIAVGNQVEVITSKNVYLKVTRK